MTLKVTTESGTVEYQHLSQAAVNRIITAFSELAEAWCVARVRVTVQS